MTYTFIFSNTLMYGCIDHIRLSLDVPWVPRYVRSAFIEFFSKHVSDPLWESNPDAAVVAFQVVESVARMRHRKLHSAAHEPSKHRSLHRAIAETRRLLKALGDSPCLLRARWDVLRTADGSDGSLDDWYENLDWWLRYGDDTDLPNAICQAVLGAVTNICSRDERPRLDDAMLLHRLESLPEALGQTASRYREALDRFAADYLGSDTENMAATLADGGMAEHPMSSGWAAPREIFGLCMDLYEMRSSEAGHYIWEYHWNALEYARAQCLSLARENPGWEYRLWEEFSGEMVFRVRVQPDTGVLYTIGESLV